MSESTARSCVNEPSISDLILDYLKDKFPDSQFSAIPRFGIEIFMDGRSIGTIYGNKYFAWSFPVSTYHTVESMFHKTQDNGINIADPKLLDVIAYTATVSGGYL